MNWLRQMQVDLRAWVQRNFYSPGNRVDSLALEQLRAEYRATRPLLGALEELGELAHAHLKASQGIRGTAAEHEEAARDAVADTVIYLMDYCNERGWDFSELLDETLRGVLKRDWVADPQSGGAAGGEESP